MKSAGTTSAPDARVEIGDGEDRIILERFIYTWRHELDVFRLILEEGFVFNGASIPWLAEPIIGDKWALGKYPPGFHDALYQCGGDLSKQPLCRCQVRRGVHVAVGSGILPAGPAEVVWEDVGHVWTRKAADRLFGRHMRELGVPPWKRRAAYLAVRLAGRGSWKD